MFAVYENNLPAKYPEQSIHPSWNNHKFQTLDEAIEYADRYFYPFLKLSPDKLTDNFYEIVCEIREEN